MQFNRFKVGIDTFQHEIIVNNNGVNVYNTFHGPAKQEALVIVHAEERALNHFIHPEEISSFLLLKIRHRARIFTESNKKIYFAACFDTTHVVPEYLAKKNIYPHMIPNNKNKVMGSNKDQAEAIMKLHKPPSSFEIIGIIQHSCLYEFYKIFKRRGYDVCVNEKATDEVKRGFVS